MQHGEPGKVRHKGLRLEYKRSCVSEHVKNIGHHYTIFPLTLVTHYRL